MSKSSAQAEKEQQQMSRNVATTNAQPPNKFASNMTAMAEKFPPGKKIFFRRILFLLSSKKIYFIAIQWRKPILLKYPIRRN